MTTAPKPQQLAARQDQAYRLASDPDERSWTVRENLVDVLERELLGPADGPEEILEGAPDAAYLVGRVAPVRLMDGRDDPTQADSDDAATDVGDAVDAAESRGVPVTAVDESSAGADEDEVEDQPQKRGLVIPASMGLRCQVPDDLDEFTVTASWGTYEPVKEKQGEGGEPVSRLRRYQRKPHEYSVSIKVSELMSSHTATLVLEDKVVLRVDRYDDVERGCRLIEIALCNDKETPRKIPVEAWLYQTKLSVSAADGAAVFLPANDALLDTREEPDDELRRLRLQYRNRLEFAVGRTCSVDWRVAEGARRATEVWTTWLPVCETPQTAAEEIGTALLDMRKLETVGAAELRAGLEPIVEGYAAWLDAEEERARELPEHLRSEGLDAVADARRVQRQLAEGLEFLLADEEALRCFRFMNRVMADQRVQSQVAQRRANQAEGSRESLDQARDAILEEKGAGAHSWRTFQLAFVLMQLPLLSDPVAEKRSGDLAKAQLLFFPTGGGKTEAYLGLAAYTFAIRRRQGVVEAFDGPLDGRSGVAVLMRYTLRLLTAQQFQRATTLMCAAERARMEDPATWGDEPFRIGLWVGTDVSPKRYDEAEAQLQKANQGRGYRLTVLQIQRCPWCGARIEARDVRADKTLRRVYVYCGDELAECPFADGGDVAEGLPVLTVDEEIYRLAPAFVIATVDKFARLAREGEAASLFGYVSRRCERHGLVHRDYAYCDIKDGSKHPRKDGLPAAAVHPTTRLRPPDLIIQDELHLITGALGTTVGLFEVAVDVMTGWRTKDGHPVRPLLVASTATARNAADQVKALYGRDVTIFPPQVLDAGNTFFSKEVEVSEKAPGRRYLGINTTGVRLTTAEIRVAEVLMAGGQLLLDRSGKAADPYMTLVGYFSATRELAGMARYMGDDIQTALAKRRPWSKLPSRSGTNFGALHVAELTSRVASADITATLDQMAVPFDPGFDSTAGKRNRRTLREAKTRSAEREVNPYDVVLATSMLQVGVDVTRLGLMLVVGQPKNTAEYIQASSRVGREAARPGLVVALGNWARPRDLAHFEQFRHYHETFYAQVEALSVTPFSVTSLERGLDGVLVSTARVLQAVRPQGLSPEDGAARIEAERHFAVELIDALVRRVAQAGDEDAAERARNRLENRLDQWGKRRKHLEELRKSLVYEKIVDDSRHDALMMSAENAKAGIDTRDAPPFIVANSMREVQPEINLLVSPIKERLVYVAPVTAPQWVMPEENA
ncbi:DISARM system helicase DrmA [Streptomyces sp. UNOC14_S4]|uniref:DISARM system helicase DrmA n=1 Tax=Streptomyces sp. UNOC14_S4 TaxID=2872340 RepID=UPI001E65365F|nr:DISARM system helicase DrmA [Streptomyces sp. UNOC14_S4]MCC3766072.1 DISARM system helicase DrmA [Streptomyces sp. UNOC14_S4]